MMDDFIFADKENNTTLPTQKPWKVLIVDDNHGVHEVTKLALKNIAIYNRPVSFTSVYSAKEAKELLENDDTFAVALIDVVIESTHAGLELTKCIRQKLLNPDLRIITRTGQSGQVPERFVIDSYDINDYKDKTELNTNKLYTSVKLAINNYSKIIQNNLEKEELYKKNYTSSINKTL